MYSGLDDNLDPNEKILAAEYAPSARPRTGFELDEASLDRSRYMGAKYDLHDMDFYGTPDNLNIWGQMANMKKLEKGQANIAQNPFFDYTTEDGIEYTGEPGSVSGSGFKMRKIKKIKGGQFGEIIGPIAISAASAALSPLIKKGASAVINWLFKKLHGKGGVAGGFNKDDMRRGIHAVMAKLEPRFKQREKNMMKTASSSGFWKSMHDDLREGIHDVVSHFTPINEGAKKVISSIASTMLTGTKKGAGLISPRAHKHIVGGGRLDGDDGDPDGVLRTGHVIRPILENIIDKHLKAGLNSAQKQGLLGLISESAQDILQEPMKGPKGSGRGGSVFGKIKDKIKSVLHKLAGLPGIKDIVKNVTSKAGEYLAPKIKQFAESGVDKLFDLVPKGTIKDIIEPHRETMKSLAGDLAGRASESIKSSVMKNVDKMAVTPEEIGATDGQSIKPKSIAPMTPVSRPSISRPSISRPTIPVPSITQPSIQAPSSVEPVSRTGRAPVRFGRGGFRRYNPYGRNQIQTRSFGKGGWRVRVEHV